MELLVKIAVDEKPDARGIAVIISIDYLNGEGSCKPLFGSRKDSEAMISAFRHIKFSIISRSNATKKEIVELINAVASYEFPDSYKYVVVVLSCHGNGSPAIFSSDDEEIDLNDVIINPLGISEYLKEKHKCIFIAAGRDVGCIHKPFETHEKVMIACSTEHGNYSADSENGCPWIQKLAEEIQVSSHYIDDILIKINKEVKKSTAQQSQIYNVTEKFCLG